MANECKLPTYTTKQKLIRKILTLADANKQIGQDLRRCRTELDQFKKEKLQFLRTQTPLHKINLLKKHGIPTAHGEKAHRTIKKLMKFYVENNFTFHPKEYVDISANWKGTSINIIINGYKSIIIIINNN